MMYGVASGQDLPEKRHAFLVGISNYTNARPLPCATKDMNALSWTLVNMRFDRVWLLSDTEAGRPRPTAANIKDFFEKFIHSSEIGNDDLVVVAYSGHGVSDENRSYICPIDCDQRKASLVPLSFFMDQLQEGNCKAKYKVMIIDACRTIPGHAAEPAPPPEEPVQNPGGNEGTIRERAAFDLAPRMNFKAVDFSIDKEVIPQGLMLITSCGSGEPSYEQRRKEGEGGLDRGVFMNFLIQGLEGWALKPPDRVLTARELFYHASSETKNYLKQLGARKKQEPYIRDNVAVDPVIGRVDPIQRSFRNLPRKQQFRVRQALVQNKNALLNTDFTGADLSGMMLKGVDFSDAKLEKAILVDTNLENADLSGANLSGADVKDASFRGADLTAATILTMKNGYQANWSELQSTAGAKTDSSTPIGRR